MAKLVEENGQYTIYYTYCTASEAREELTNKMYELSKSPESRTFWWRATSNKHEDEICHEICSVNHATGEHEAGLSVSESTSYQYFNDDYTYIYPVTGDVVGTGSDGEPILKNAVALAKPTKSPSKKYLKKEEAFNKLPKDLVSLMCAMCRGIQAINNTTELKSLI